MTFIFARRLRLVVSSQVGAFASCSLIGTQPESQHPSMVKQVIERGRPADYGQEITRRRTRVSASWIPLAGRVVLDFGAGNGAQTVELVKHGCRMVACDIDAADLGVLADYVRENSIQGVSILHYDGGLLPLEDRTIDAVVSFATLEHVQDEARALSEMVRVLKPGGDLVISVPNKWWVFETHGARLPLLPWNRVPFFSWLPPSIHRRWAKARIYRRRDVVRLLQEHRLKVVRTVYMTAPMDVVRSPRLQALLRSAIFRGDTTRWPFLATEVVVHCRKQSLEVTDQPSAGSTRQ